MRILIANDDGIDAGGLAFLERAARILSDDVWVVAPQAKRSGASHSLTLHRPYTLTKVGERRYACSGTPADCVVAAMTGLFREGGPNGPRPDLVLAGVNEGRNVAEDIGYSGTIGIAREATFWGLPAIALSRTKGGSNGEAEISWLGHLLKGLVERRGDWALEGHWLSVNLPNALPAPLRQPRIGRDKIARTAEILSDENGILTLKTSSARAHASTPGDEHAEIDLGHVCILRLNWFGQTLISQDLLTSLG